MTATKIMILGLGKIGSAIADLLHHTGEYDIIGADQTLPAGKTNYTCIGMKLDEPLSELKSAIQQYQPDALLSCLPYFLNIKIATLASAHHINYFDISEDEHNRLAMKTLAPNATSAIVPQCGLAPGIVNILAAQLAEPFDELYDLYLRVGAIPQQVSNYFKYQPSWSSAGLVNEYIQPCELIENGHATQAKALDDLEHITLNGNEYEAFNTSGGIGSLVEHFNNCIHNLNYKTLRHLGHHDAVALLLNDFQMRFEPKALVELIDKHIGLTNNDQVLLYVNVKGNLHNREHSNSCLLIFHPAVIHDKRYTAIQTTTALGACAMLECVLKRKLIGYVAHHQLSWDNIINTQFGRMLREYSYSWQGI